MHLEKDAGKSLHDSRTCRIVDLNRSASPLMEMYQNGHPLREQARLCDQGASIRATSAPGRRMEKGSLRVTSTCRSESPAGRSAPAARSRT